MNNRDRLKKILSKDGIFYSIYWGAKLLRLDKYMSDKLYVCLQYRCYTGRTLNLKHPRLFSEKLCWMKLYDHNPFYSVLVDKLKVKDYVTQRIGSEYVIPTIKEWNKPEDISIENLPNQFVLKDTCGGNNLGVVICHDKSTFSINEAIKKLRKSFDSDMYMSGREWPYKNVGKKIIAENYIEDLETGELRDYKFFCFDGVVKALFIGTERQSKDGVKFDFFDNNFNYLPIINGHPNASTPPQKPKCFYEMKLVAEKLSKGIPQVRVDLYEANGKVYFGEMTMFHHNGTCLMQPIEWEYRFGEWLDLSKYSKR